MAVRIAAETNHTAICCDHAGVQEASGHVHHRTEPHWNVALAISVVSEAHQLRSFVHNAGVAAAGGDSPHSAKVRHVALAIGVGSPTQKPAVSCQSTGVAKLGGNGTALKEGNKAAQKLPANLVHEKSWHPKCVGVTAAMLKCDEI